METKKLNLAFVYNVRHKKPSLTDEQAIAEAEFDEPSTINGIAHALRKLGHEIYRIEANEEAYAKLKSLKNKLDLVFNVAEGLRNQDREAQIPAMLENLDIPYVGSKPLAQALCLNKAYTKKVLSYHQIPTPRFQLFYEPNERLSRKMHFPLIVKPVSEGSSKGITNDCLVNNQMELYKKLAELIEKFKQPALVEEFLTGREFTVALIGNSPVEVLPPVEILFDHLPNNLAPMDSYEVKWILDNPESNLKTIACPAQLDYKKFLQIKKLCLKTKQALGILDWCRIDVRMDSDGRPHVLEINQIPGIMPDPKENSRFPLAARTAGYTYEEMMHKIIKAACERYGIPVSPVLEPAPEKATNWLIESFSGQKAFKLV
ncbi:MAG: ATP-grasp domain-containing protein [Candidatus Magasanikbacteria bacterium]|nr:ATP-grasp domain-containing protein [Candidatus Magasanikbacteria bacterium]